MGKLYTTYDNIKLTSLVQSSPSDQMDVTDAVEGGIATAASGGAATYSKISWFIKLLNKWKNEKMIREVERQIPDGILPEGFEGNLVDVSPATRGDDDNYFRKNDEIRNHLPRGLSLLNVGVRGGSSECSVAIYANRKFFNLDIDSLSGTNTSGEDAFDKYFLGSVSTASCVVAMEKVNGEAAHFSGRFINGQFYLIAGSKNVHLIFREREHIELYTEKRYSIAKEVAHAVLDTWNRMALAKQLSLAQYLHFSCRTVVCEIMRPSHQHIVDLRDLSNTKLVVLAVTGPPSETLKSQTALPSEQTLKKFSSIGFNVPNYEVLDPFKVLQHALQTRETHNSEGMVYYYEDCEGNTLGLVKVKTSWYVHLRALRQQGAYRHVIKKSAPSTTLEHSKERSRRRMEDLQVWLYTTNEELEAWKILSDQWLEWLEGEVQSSAVTVQQIKENFAFVWQLFREHQQVTSFFSQQLQILEVIYS